VEEGLTFAQDAGGSGRIAGYKHLQRCSLFDVDLFAMLDQSDGSEEYGQRDCRSCRVVSRLVPRPTKHHSGVTYSQVVQPDVEFSAPAHHAGSFGVADLAHGFVSGLGNHDIIDDQILGKNQIDRVALGCGMGGKVLCEFELHI